MSTKRIENIIITVVWTLIFISPLPFQYYLAVTEKAWINMHDLSMTYSFLFAFFVLFLIHNYLLIPLLHARKRYVIYGASVAIMLFCFALYQKSIPHGHQPKDIRKEHIALHDIKPKFHEEDRHIHEFRIHKKDNLLSPPDMARLIIALLMLGVNLGVNAMIKAQVQHRRLTELEQQNLKQELDYLKHQINPHFFMNTLNNIHVLIDLDKEKAKRSIVELSKLMRYMLYDGNGSLVLLSKEIDFISQYLSLMKLRYNKKVSITSHMPETTNGLKIPPLLLVTFIENAFKHGISYQQPSFIYIALNVNEADKTVHFECSNSRHASSQNSDYGGIGMENVRKRLDLIYDNNYKLVIEDNNPDRYRVILELKSL